MFYVKTETGIGSDALVIYICLYLRLDNVCKAFQSEICAIYVKQSKLSSFLFETQLLIYTSKVFFYDYISL